MRDLNTVRFSHFKPSYNESNKTIRLHVTIGISMWIQPVKKGIKIPLINLFNARIVATLEADK